MTANYNDLYSNKKRVSHESLNGFARNVAVAGVIHRMTYVFMKVKEDSDIRTRPDIGRNQDRFHSERVYDKEIMVAKKITQCSNKCAVPVARI